MTNSLPSDPSLLQLKHQAKDILRAHTSGEDSACITLKHLTRFTDKSNQEILSGTVSLQEVQHALALDYGFDSWQTLRQTVLNASPSADRRTSSLLGDIRINLLPRADESRAKKDANPNLVLQISSSSVRLLELHKAGPTYRVERYGVEPLPPRAVAEKNITDVKVVGEAIGRLVKRSGTEENEVAMAVAGSGLLTKTIEMAADMSDDDREKEINSKADQYLPFPLDKVVLDFEVSCVSPRNKDQVEVLLAACLRELIDVRRAVAELGGLTATVIDIESHCVQRACQLIAAQIAGEPNQVVAIVNFGATLTTLNVVTTGPATPYTPFTREQLFGGTNLTEEIQRRYGLSVEAAELAKRQGGLPDDYEEEVLQPFRAALCQQMSDTLQFFYSSSQYDAVDRIVLSGGSASISGLADMMTSEFAVPTTIANPIAAMELSSNVDALELQSDAPALMIACGLAMRSSD